MSTVKICGYTTFQVELTIYKLVASNILKKIDGKRLLNKCSKIFNNATDELEAVVEELNNIILGEK